MQNYLILQIDAFGGDELDYNIPQTISWKGNFNKNKAFWEAPCVEIGLEIFNYVRECIGRVCEEQ